MPNSGISERIFENRRRLFRSYHGGRLLRDLSVEFFFL
jgi:hypothetical protein